MITIVMFIVTMTVPRIMPINVNTGKKQIEKWLDESEANDDFDRTKQLKQSLKSYDFESPLFNIGTIALSYSQESNANKIVALALIERIQIQNETVLKILNIETSDYYSGTSLVKKMVSVYPAAILDTKIHPKWKIAMTYFKSNDI